MKTIPLLILSLISFSAHSLEVVELNSGSCWVSSDGLKMASFGEGKSFLLDDESLSKIHHKMQQELKPFKIKLSNNFEIYLHCNSFNSHLVFKFKDERICAWVTHDGKIDSIGNYEGSPKGLCDTAIPGELLVYGEIPSQLEPLWDKYIESFPTLNKLILTKEFYYKEDIVIEKLKASFPNIEIERNYLIYRTGEYLKLRSPEFIK